jgi:Tfp pilus assembly protein PilO
LHHLETKYEKLLTIISNDHVKDTYRQTLALKQEIHNLRRIINLHDVPPKQSAVKNRGLNFWAKH